MMPPTRDDGGPAFPGRIIDTIDADGTPSYTSVPGMSLRDWFAGTVVLTPLELKRLEASNPTIENQLELEATLRYAKADAMLKARDANG